MTDVFRKCDKCQKEQIAVNYYYIIDHDTQIFDPHNKPEKKYQYCDTCVLEEQDNGFWFVLAKE